jgi:hypothetical protein
VNKCIIDWSMTRLFKEAVGMANKMGKKFLSKFLRFININLNNKLQIIKLKVEFFEGQVYCPRV